MKIVNLKKFNLSQQFLLVALGITTLIIISVSIYMVNSSIQAKVAQLSVMANGRSASVIEKIDRNFYERYGDVQAFAFNNLAKEMASTDSVTKQSQQFINTMISYYVLYDLMMVCNINGDFVAANTMDKNGEAIRTDFLKSKNFANEEWFKQCISDSGLPGGAWYSDFMENTDVSAIYNRNGSGMAFAAPIKNNEGTITGVWYNFANWSDVTSGIRKETENAIKETQPGAFILITNSDNLVIDSDDSKIIGNAHLSAKDLADGIKFNFLEKEVDLEHYIVGSKEGTGAYTYKGKNWNAITFIPRTKFTWHYLRENLSAFLLIMVAVLVVIGFIYYKLASSVSKSINKLKTDIEHLSNGELVVVNDTDQENEIGKMTKAVKSLVTRMSETAYFAKQVGEENFVSDYNALSEKDVLGKSLVTMRDNLKSIKEDEAKRTWATEGFAKFSEILRNQTDLTKLGDEIITNVVKYVKANQGALFLLNDDSATDIHLNMLSCYAWERKKFTEQKVYPGEGLVGQCWMENDVIYLTQIPKEYIKITSGLGGASPKSIIILPLNLNGAIFGVIELASFEEIKSHEREFLSKLCENIASTLSTTKVNLRTTQLLEQSQQQAEELRAQEEEVRQNLEELSATQEEMGRKNVEMERLMAESLSVVNGINAVMATIEFTPQGFILNANDNWLKTVNYSLSEIKGKHHKLFVPDEILDSNEYRNFWSDLADGKSKTGIFKRKDANKKDLWLNAIYNPILNGKGEVTKIIKYASDITNQQNLAAENNSILNGINIMMATIEFTPDGTIIDANENWLSAVGYSLLQIKGKHHQIFVSDDHRLSDEYKKFWNQLASGQAQSGIFNRKDSMGNTVVLNAIYNPIRNANGTVIKVLKIANIVTKSNAVDSFSTKMKAVS